MKTSVTLLGAALLALVTTVRAEEPAVAPAADAAAPAIALTEAAPAVPSAATITPEMSEKGSYAFGVEMGQQLNQNFPPEINREAFLRGVTEALAGKTPTLPEEEMQTIRQEFMQALQAGQAAKAEGAKAENLAKGEKFLAENKTREGVKTTESGLQYEVITEGTGAKPTATDTVTVHYEGTLLNGEVFDSSIKRNSPASFPLSGVIPGWTEGLQLMSVGSKYKFFIPSNLAYGENGSGGSIGPNETLTFEVELLKIGEEAAQ
jgi:FKBP-type peptidyl-prolyl cis-trans isomerase